MLFPTIVCVETKQKNEITCPFRNVCGHLVLDYLRMQLNMFFEMINSILFGTEHSI